MKIYTKKGDQGTTSLIGGTKVSKAHLRIESYGTVDELNSYIGVVRSFVDENDETYDLLHTIQSNLFVMGALLAAEPGKNKMKLPELAESDVQLLEDKMDEYNEDLDELKSFIIPAGSAAVSHCHVARCICRRAERTVVRLAEADEVPGLLIIYLNRLSDYLFTLARKVGKAFGNKEIVWQA